MSNRKNEEVVNRGTCTGFVLSPIFFRMTGDAGHHRTIYSNRKLTSERTFAKHHPQ